MTKQPKLFTIPAPSLRLMREFVKGVIAGIQYVNSDVLDEPDEWIEWSTKYDINIYRNRAGNLTAAVHPVLPHPTDPQLRTTDGDRFVKLDLN